jgi:hypothetical protein
MNKSVIAMTEQRVFTKFITILSEDKRMWFTQVEVAPAAYHIKFLVDGVWKTSDALPLATDSGGRLVNYIDVRTKGPEIKEWGRDWWGVGTEEEEEQGLLIFINFTEFLFSVISQSFRAAMLPCCMLTSRL